MVVTYPHQALDFVKTRELVDLRSYVDDPAWGFTADEQADFYPVFWEQDVLDGARLGIPAQRYGQVLYYNTTWAKELGYSIAPVLPQQFQEQACAAARSNRQDGRPENDGTGGWIVSTDYAAMLSWIYSFGGEIVKTPEPSLDQPVYQFNTPEMEETFTFLRGLYDAGCAWLAESDYPEAEFASRLGLFATGSTADIPRQAEAFKRAGSADQWTAIPFPSPRMNSAIYVYGPSFNILPSSPERQLAAWLLLKWLVAPQNQARMTEVGGAFPVRRSALSGLEGYKNRYPQWAAALEQLARARSEPQFQSWGTVRWALSDASTQLFRSYFSIDQLPKLLAYLDRVAADLHIGPELSGVYHTPTVTPTPSPTATRTSRPTETVRPTRTPRSTASPTPVP
jgi:ABC-type glycerol-3-phosphate transport system substrate-binding protein